MNTGVGMRRKLRSGYIFTLIIALLEIICILYKLFEVNIPILESFIGIIEDCSTIFTIIGVSFGVISLARSCKAYSLTLLCLIDIILLNDLYSNKKLLEIVQWISSWKSVFVIVVVVVCVIVAIVTWSILSRKRMTNQEKSFDYIENFESTDSETARANLKGQRTSSQNDLSQNKSPQKHEATIMPFYIVKWICTAAGIFVALWGGLDYLLFDHLDLGLVRPALFAWDPAFLHYAVIISLASLVALELVYWIIGLALQKTKNRKGSLSFRGSAIAAILLEIASIYAVNKIDIGVFHDGLLSAVTDNLFSSFLIIVLLFLVLQIICTMLYHLVTKNSLEDNLVKKVKDSVIRIEEALVDLAFSLLEGCVKLFDFIPDFFDTIGVILLDNKKPQKERKDEEKDDKKRV